MARVGLFGGSFNPIHHGHLIVARAVREALGLDEVILLPSGRPPHKLDVRLAQASHRLEMVRRAIDGEPGFSLHDHDLREGPSYTIETIAYFQSLRRGDELVWMIGADSLAELPTWHRAEDLVRTTFIATALRSGVNTVDWPMLEKTFSTPLALKLRSGVVETPIIDISSTDIRARIAMGRSIRYLVPDAVRNYIESATLYHGTHHR